MILNLAEAAALVNETEANIRNWVQRNHLRKIPHTRPMLFRQEDVTQCAHDRMSQAEHDRLDALWALTEPAVAKETEDD